MPAMKLAGWYRMMREVGVDPKRLPLILRIPRYLRELRDWRRQGGLVSRWYPVLGGWSDEAGSASGAYFHQDLLVARLVYELQPSRHIDVGSRVDGFVAHVAVFREIDVLDIRPIRSSVRNVRFIQGDLLRNSGSFTSSTDSLSCLHALEHFGLGRYGDPIDPHGHLKGFRCLIDMLKVDGTLYLSFPIGKPAVEYNAHRVFDSQEVLSWPGSELLRLKRFDFVDDAGALHEDVPPDEIGRRCSGVVHGCGVYTFTRLG